MPNPSPAIALLTHALGRDGEADWRESEVTGCGECAEAVREAAELRQRLARANALLRLIARTEQRPAKREGIEDNPLEASVVGYAATLAAIKARIEIYFQAAR